MASVDTDYDRMSERYDRGRSLDGAGLVAWREALEPYLGKDPQGPVLDLGAGTGIFAELLSGWFEFDVVAVEPSAGMLRTGAEKRSSRRIRWIRGAAEAIPLRDGVCGAAWLSVSLHHFSDTAVAAREIRRVLAPGAPLLIRQAFSGRCERITWRPFFPEAAELIDRRWPTVERVERVFADVGFSIRHLEAIPQVSSATRTEFVERLQTRADSTLTLISDEAFDRGMDRLRVWAEEKPDEPVTDWLDLAVLA